MEKHGWLFLRSMASAMDQRATRKPRSHGGAGFLFGLVIGAMGLCVSPQAAELSAAPLLPKGALPAGYVAIPIKTAWILAPGKNSAIESIRLTGEWDLVMNGTFYDASFRPVGTVYHSRKEVAAGIGKARRRGAVAVLADGSLRLCLQPEETGPEALQAACARGEAPISGFLGGGALLLKDRVATSSDHLYRVQRFDNGGQGLDADQFRKTTHSLIALYPGGTPYAIAALNKNGREMQRDLIHAGFLTAVMLDGGSGFHFRTPAKTYGKNRNPTGLLIQTH